MRGYAITRDDSREIVGERPLDVERISVLSLRMATGPEPGTTAVTVYGRTDIVSGASRRQASEAALETIQDVNALASAVQTRAVPQ